MTDYILETIEEYIRAEEPLHYGLMLKGKWGCGKTYYIKNTVRPELKKSIPKIGAKEKTGVYVSLNGLQATEEIDNQINMILLTKSEGKENKVIGFLSSAVSSVISASKKTKAVGDIVKRGMKEIAQLMAETNDIYLIFDDVERCEIPINRLFGYINRFVEQCDKRVILIADETKLVEIENYRSIKEKLIGQTLDYRPSEDEIVRASIDKIGNSKTKAILNDHYDVIKNCFANSESNNIRLLCMGLRHIDRIVRTIQSKIDRLARHTLENLVQLTLGLTFEIGKADSEIEFIKKSLTEVRFRRNRRKEEKTDADREYEKREKFNRLFKNRYLSNSRHNFIFESVFQFVSESILDKAKLEKHLGIDGDPQPEDVFEHLKYYDSLNGEEFDKLVERAIRYAVSGEFSYPVYYLKTVYKCMRFQSKGLIEVDVCNLASKVKKGIETTTKQHYHLDVTSPDMGFTDDIEKLSPGHSKLFQNLLTYTRECIEKSRDQKVKEALTESMNNNLGVFSDIIRGRHEPLALIASPHFPAFTFVDPKQLSNRLAEGPTQNIHMLKDALKAKYLIYQTSAHYFTKELDFFAAFKKDVECIQEKQPNLDKIKKYCLSLLLEDLSTIIANLTSQGQKDA